MTEKNNTGTKMRIVENAIELFKERGYEDVTVSDICAVTGLTRGAFYYHFDTKAEVLDNYFLSTDSLAMEGIIPLIGSNDYLEQFYHVFNIYLDHNMAAGPEVFGQILKRSIDRGLHLMNPDEIAMRSVYISFIEKAQEAGQIKNTTPAEVLVDCIVYAAVGIAMVWCNKKGEMDIKAEHKRMLDALFMIEEK